MYHWSLGIIHMDLDALVVYGEVLARQCSGSAEWYLWRYERRPVSANSMQAEWSSHGKPKVRL